MTKRPVPKVKAKVNKAKNKRRQSPTGDSENHVVTAQNSQSTKTHSRKSPSTQSTHCKVTSKHYLKWRPLAQTTSKMVTAVLDINAREVLNLCSSRSHTEIQQHLGALKHRVLRKLDKIKAPVPKEDYTQLENNRCMLGESLSEAAARIHNLQDEMDRVERLLEAGDETLEELKRKLVVAETKVSQQEQAETERSRNRLHLPMVPFQQGRQKTGGDFGSNGDVIAMLQDITEDEPT